MNTIGLDKYHVQVASTWNELTKRNLLFFATIFPIEKSQVREIKIRLILNLLNVRRNLRLQWKLFRCDDEQIYALSELTNFLFEGNELTKWLIPSVRIGWKTYYGPSDNLINVSLIEFSKADTYYLKYLKTKDEAWLNKMIAVLYRPKKVPYRPKAIDFDGEIRQQYNGEHVAAREKKFTRLPIPTKKAILINYQGVRNNLEKCYPHVFRTRKKGKNLGWAPIILELAGDKFGNEERTAHSRLHTILIYMELVAVQRIEQERKNKKNS